MRYLSIVFFVALSNCSNGQNIHSQLNSEVNQIHKFSIKDTIPNTCYEKVRQRDSEPAFFINDNYVNIGLPSLFDLERVKSIEVLRDSVEINNCTFYGKIMIELEKGYSPKFISVEELIFKHTNLDKLPDIVIVDNVILEGDFYGKSIDEHYILKIVVKELESAQNGNKISIVKLITRTEENVKEANTIVIRGFDDI